MKIEFFNKETGDILMNTDDWYFVMNNEVYRNNDVYYESQEASIGFDDCVFKVPRVGWRVL